MVERIGAPDVGAPDPEKRNSPIIEETDEDYDVAGMEATEFAACYFNGEAFSDNQLICSGDELLRCMRGNWIRLGTCHPENP